MFTDAKTHQKIAALMQRVLIVDPQPAAIKLLSELLRDVSHCQIWTAIEARAALTLAERIEPHLIFVEQCPGVDGARFTKELRRSDLRCRKAAVIMISAEATAASIIGARDAGVHEFLRKPFTIKDLVRRLEAVALRPRDWVEGINYVGPDRRRFNSGDYSGTLKRRVDHAETPDDGRIVQALKILRAAVGVIGDDPRQALRALTAQVEELTVVAMKKNDMGLRAEAVALGQKLYGLDAILLRRSEIEPLAAPLLARLPTDEGSAAAQRPAA